MRKIKNYIANKSGNFSIMFALSLTMLMVVVGVAVDMAKIASTHSKLQSIADSAALAGAIHAEAKGDEREELVQAIIDTQLANAKMTGLGAKPTISFDDGSDQVLVVIEAELPMMMGKFTGKATRDVSAQTTTSFAVSKVEPISLVFALDVSGSMNLPTSEGAAKIDTLKSSIPALFDAIEQGSKRPDLVIAAIRTGISTYNTDLILDHEMDDGWDHLDAAVSGLTAAGGTNSTPALQNAYDQLKEDRDYRESRGDRLENLKEFVIFMTDGDNNQPEWDVETQSLCVEMRADGVNMYSIAFAAPEKGELLLLDCASDNSQPEEGVTGDGEGCKNLGAQGKGKAHGKSCPASEDLSDLDDDDVEDLEEEKSAHYYDAEDAESFRQAFEDIGREIAKSSILIKS